MRFPLLILLALILGTAGAVRWYAVAQEASETATVVAPSRPLLKEQNCLSAGDMREAVAEKRVVEPVAAIRAARLAVPKAEIVRASLCRNEQELVYQLTALRKDGHFVHVTVDARSGKVAETW